MGQQKIKMHVKKGDTVKIIAGKDKGKISEIIKVISKKGKVIVKDINIQIKHVRPKQKDETGQIIQIEAPIHSSNVMLYSKKHEIASRFNYIRNEQNIKQRILKKTGEKINNSNDA